MAKIPAGNGENSGDWTMEIPVLKRIFIWRAEFSGFDSTQVRQFGKTRIEALGYLSFAKPAARAGLGCKPREVQRLS